MIQIVSIITLAAVWLDLQLIIYSTGRERRLIEDVVLKITGVAAAAVGIYVCVRWDAYMGLVATFGVLIIGDTIMRALNR